MPCPCVTHTHTPNSLLGTPAIIWSSIEFTAHLFLVMKHKHTSEHTYTIVYAIVKHVSHLTVH